MFSRYFKFLSFLIILFQSSLGRTDELDTLHGVNSILKKEYTYLSFAYAYAHIKNGLIENLLRYGDEKDPVVSLIQELFHAVDAGNLRQSSSNNRLGSYLKTPTLQKIISTLAFSGPELRAETLMRILSEDLLGFDSVEAKRQHEEEIQKLENDLREYIQIATKSDVDQEKIQKMRRNIRLLKQNPYRSREHKKFSPMIEHFSSLLTEAQEHTFSGQSIYPFTFSLDLLMAFLWLRVKDDKDAVIHFYRELPGFARDGVLLSEESIQAYLFPKQGYRNVYTSQSTSELTVSRKLSSHLDQFLVYQELARRAEEVFPSTVNYDTCFYLQEEKNPKNFLERLKKDEEFKKFIYNNFGYADCFESFLVNFMNLILSNEDHEDDRNPSNIDWLIQTAKEHGHQVSEILIQHYREYPLLNEPYDLEKRLSWSRVTCDIPSLSYAGTKTSLRCNIHSSLDNFIKFLEFHIFSKDEKGSYKKLKSYQEKIEYFLKMVSTKDRIFSVKTSGSGSQNSNENVTITFSINGFPLLNASIQYHSHTQSSFVNSFMSDMSWYGVLTSIIQHKNRSDISYEEELFMTTFPLTNENLSYRLSASEEKGYLDYTLPLQYSHDVRLKFIKRLIKRGLFSTYARSIKRLWLSLPQEDNHTQIEILSTLAKLKKEEISQSPQLMEWQDTLVKSFTKDVFLYAKVASDESTATYLRDFLPSLSIEDIEIALSNPSMVKQLKSSASMGRHIVDWFYHIIQKMKNIEPLFRKHVIDEKRSESIFHHLHGYSPNLQLYESYYSQLHGKKDAQLHKLIREKVLDMASVNRDIFDRLLLAYLREDFQEDLYEKFILNNFDHYLNMEDINGDKSSLAHILRKGMENTPQDQLIAFMKHRPDSIDFEFYKDLILHIINKPQENKDLLEFILSNPQEHFPLEDNNNSLTSFKENILDVLSRGFIIAINIDQLDELNPMSALYITDQLDTIRTLYIYFNQKNPVLLKKERYDPVIQSLASAQYFFHPSLNEKGLLLLEEFLQISKTHKIKDKASMAWTLRSLCERLLNFNNLENHRDEEERTWRAIKLIIFHNPTFLIQQENGQETALDILHSVSWIYGYKYFLNRFPSEDNKKLEEIIDFVRHNGHYTLDDIEEEEEEEEVEPKDKGGPLIEDDEDTDSSDAGDEGFLDNTPQEQSWLHRILEDITQGIGLDPLFLSALPARFITFVLTGLHLESQMNHHRNET